MKVDKNEMCTLSKEDESYHSNYIPQPKTIKIVINRSFGHFCVSKKVYDKLGLSWDFCGFLKDFLKSKGYPSPSYSWRVDEDLIKAIEEVGIENASGYLAELKIVEIPSDVEWYIDEHDGIESVHEVHRIWT